MIYNTPNLRCKINTAIPNGEVYQPGSVFVWEVSPYRITKRNAPCTLVTEGE